MSICTKQNKGNSFRLTNLLSDLDPVNTVRIHKLVVTLSQVWQTRVDSVKSVVNWCWQCHKWGKLELIMSQVWQTGVDSVTSVANWSWQCHKCGKLVFGVSQVRQTGVRSFTTHKCGKLYTLQEVTAVWLPHGPYTRSLDSANIPCVSASDTNLQKYTLALAKKSCKGAAHE